MKGTPKYFSELYAEERASGFGYRASAESQSLKFAKQLQFRQNFEFAEARSPAAKAGLMHVAVSTRLFSRVRGALKFRNYDFKI